MDVAGDAAESAFERHVFALLVERADLVEMIVDRRRHRVHVVVGDLVQYHQHRHHRHRGDGMAETVLIVGRRERRVERILLLQQLQMPVVNGDHFDLAHQRQLRHVGVGIARAHEERVDLVVLKGVLALRLAQEALVDVVVVHAVNAENLAGRHLVSRADRAHADALAAHVGHALDAAGFARHDLHHFGIAGRDRREIRHRAAGELLHAVQRVTVHIRLHQRHLVFALFEKAHVLHRAARGTDGDVGPGMSVDDLREHAAEGIIIPRGAARSHQKAAGNLALGRERSRGPHSQRCADGQSSPCASSHFFLLAIERLPRGRPRNNEQAYYTIIK